MYPGLTIVNLMFSSQSSALALSYHACSEYLDAAYADLEIIVIFKDVL